MNSCVPFLELMQESDSYRCRVCLADENDISSLISPCGCKGSLKYVHMECHSNWRKMGAGDALNVCSVCKVRYSYSHYDLAVYSKQIRVFVFALLFYLIDPVNILFKEDFPINQLLRWLFLMLHVTHVFVIWYNLLIEYTNRFFNIERLLLTTLFQAVLICTVIPTKKHYVSSALCIALEIIDSILVWFIGQPSIIT